MKENWLKPLQSVKKIFTRYPIVEVARTTLAQPALVWAYQFRSIEVKQLPARMMIDPCNICNLKCTLCPTPKHIDGMTQTRMPFEMFEHIVGLNPRLKMLDLFNLGEPFLNKDIFKMLELTRKKKIRTAVHTNLSAYDTDLVERIVETPPTRLHISVDGMSQETYGIYRIGGDFEKVKRNMEYLSKRIKETGRGPSVEWGFLYHKGNQKDIPAVKAFAEKLGFKAFIRPLVSPENQRQTWHTEETLAREAISFKNNVACPHLWLSMMVKPNGKLGFCCFAYMDSEDLSEPLTTINTPEELLALWNSAPFKRGRACFRKDSKFREIKQPILCEKCDLYQRHGGLDPQKHFYDTPFRYLYKGM